MHFIITCAAGLESILKKEIELAGYTVIGSGPTMVRFKGDLSAIAKMNLRSRVGNKVFLELAQYITSDFNQLFDLVSTIDRPMYVQGNPIVVTAVSKTSQLSSTPTIQSIVKKSIVKRLQDTGPRSQVPGKIFEDPKLQPVEVFVHIENDMCSILLNTTGESLHKRGYKTFTGDAPINEALAAGLLLLSGWKFSEPLYDFFCGSGTIAIEAALLAKNIAPGSFRTFAFESWDRYDKSILLDIKKNLLSSSEGNHQTSFLNKEHTIVASDIDPEMIRIAEENAKIAGVIDYITFETKDIKDYLDGPSLDGCLVSNPPYGRRLNIFDTEHLYHNITELFVRHPKLHGGIITSYEKFDTDTGSGSRKKTMLYNGGERCWFYKKTLLK